MSLQQRSGIHFRWSRMFGSMPGIGASLLPVGVCPACWPVYAGVLSSLGLGFLVHTTYLLPLTAAFLLFSLGTLAYWANARHGYGPFALGLLAAVGILVGKFGVSSDVLFYISAPDEEDRSTLSVLKKNTLGTKHLTGKASEEALKAFLSSERWYKGSTVAQLDDEVKERLIASE